MLIDHAKIYVIGGTGGKGCSSLFKDIFNRMGIPDGGNGGDGGDVVLEGSSQLQTLLDFRYNPHHKAKGGKHGGSNHKVGKRGEDLVLRIPLGTIVIDAESGLAIKDIVKDGERVIAAKGGKGGKGNAGRKEATPGEEGESKTLILELKLVADVGIIGFPNAGKSTLVSRISKAHSKIAPYPFTTKNPVLGVVVLGDDASFVAADMPGLIEGAHAGKGLGDKFLRHIERTLVLVHLVDLAPVDGSDPYGNYLKIEKELELYGEGVHDKPRVVAGNKIEMPGARENLEAFRKAAGVKVHGISALTGEGLKELVAAIYEEISDVRQKYQEDDGEGWDEGPDRQGEPDRQERA